MYLKSLTLRGFKSFASSTTLQLEPGITAVVGPNGSGKSNVVDALSWVMGEQGAKSLRGGKMEDVIFAGTSGRPPLGRAEVVLTIDNADGALPIEYSEVTISRTMFRNGGSEYAINGNTCRLLDVQELLSDSGIGREMHVIVGQGQLDSVLRATPEERRGFIEEAAGVLKHRKRKEKALRKLDATQGNLTRLNDVLTELRRQLKPLGRQAEVARRAAVIQADVRDARARLLADDIVTARTTIETELADEAALKQRRQGVEQAIAAAREQETELEDQLREDSPRLSAAQETWYGLSGLRERLRGTAGLANERIRLAAVEADDRREGREPEELEAEARRAQEQHEQLSAGVARATQALEAVIAERGEAETAYTAEERRVAGLLRAAADQREGLARLHGQVNALKSRATAAGEEIGRLTAARQEAESRAVDAQRQFTALENEIAGLNAGESGLDEKLEAAEADLEQAIAGLTALAARLNEAERQQAGLAARKEALELGLSRKDGAGALLAATDEISGLLGSVAALLTVRSGFEAAIAAALGSAADAVAVDHLDTAVSAMQRLKSEDLGRAGMLLGGGEVDDSSWPGLPDEATYAIDVVDGPPALQGALRRLLFKVAVVDTLEQAQDVVRVASDVTAVTRDGDILGAHFAAGGSTSKQSLIEVQAALDAAETDLGAAAHTIERLRFEQEALEAARAAAQERVDASLGELHESDATMAAVAENLGHLGATSRAARGEAERLAAAIAKAEESMAGDLSGLAELEDRLAQAQSAPEEEPDTALLEELAEKASGCRRAETDARLALRTNEERARALAAQVTSLFEAAEAERDARARAAERRARQLREAETARAVITAADHVLARLEASIAVAASLRASIEQSRSGREETLRAVRTQLRDLMTQLDGLTDTVHKDEMARAELRLRLEGLEARALEELGLDVDSLVADYGPDQLVPPVTVEGEDESLPAEPVPYDREAQVKRLRSAERSMAMLGKVNPLALEEFTALEERHQFLSEQLDDLRKTRKDLLEIVEEVDAKVEQVFTEAWYDVESAFQHVFTRLFPGGEGALILTDPQNMLTTGIDVEARPAGKKVKRLSLLSGGERSLVAVAFLVALFKARPSPFYILDEVEAALDDANLGRLLELYEELRANSQLVVITHQKRTMEVADALYGVSMRGDGVSAVISQRLREEEPA
ncbi:chromosome segregation protein SMC [Aeromicrobium fastidiosum]|uniref:Chromosome partition protein Smc n=1 Tax=Aeromicrobium fastidiosum TaxID=52699 RepID=A0A641AJC3_9ACTN|nr:chromosome segregation protein SMC [Aeromicrobium fastidiosum]KAA1372438.1 chromosome segregation protein SMC [Aeromicrobium fastidiosum]MBP2391488.1 chromosome segregation protein [Aeromicrobium fastidiosum]